MVLSAVVVRIVVMRSVAQAITLAPGTVRAVVVRTRMGLSAVVVRTRMGLSAVVVRTKVMVLSAVLVRTTVMVLSAKVSVFGKLASRLTAPSAPTDSQHRQHAHLLHHKGHPRSQIPRAICWTAPF